VKKDGWKKAATPEKLGTDFIFADAGGQRTGLSEKLNLSPIFNRFRKK
jgi:hypothetical protein